MSSSSEQTHYEISVAQIEEVRQEKLDEAARIINLLPTNEIDAVELYLNTYGIGGLKTVLRFIREVRRDRDPSTDET
jgi:hypothetical protein